MYFLYESASQVKSKNTLNILKRTKKSFLSVKKKKKKKRSLLFLSRVVECFHLLDSNYSSEEGVDPGARVSA